MMIQPVTMTLLATHLLTKRVKHFVLAVPKARPFHFIPGQFVTLHFEREGVSFKRSYSIANSDTSAGRLEFAAGYVAGGAASEYLFGLQAGDLLNVTGPFGRLILKAPFPKRLILIGTSTGVTPYRAMIPMLLSHLETDSAFQVVILQGVSYSSDVLYREDFESLKKAYPERVTLRMQLSREKTPLLPHEYLGYCQTSFDDLQLSPSSDVVYLCGNPGMIDFAFSSLKSLGFLPNQIIREKYISPSKSSRANS